MLGARTGHLPCPWGHAQEYWAKEDRSMEHGRDTSRDGRANRRETFLLTHGAPLWHLAQRHRRIERYVNGRLVNKASAKMPYRPNPFSTMAGYTSWASLTDKKFSGRHLPGSADV